MNRFFFWKRDPAEQGSNAGTGDTGDPAPAGLLTGDPARDEESLQILLESIAEVSAALDLDHVLERIVDRSLQITHADRAMLLLGSGPDDLTVRIARSGAGEDLGADIDYSRTVVKRTLGELRAGQYRIQSSEEAAQLGQSVFDLKLRTVLCAPLVAKDHVVGVIYVDSKATRGEFSSRDLALFDALSAQLAVSVENARLYEDSIQKARLEQDVEIARQIQRHLLPKVPDNFPGLDIALHFAAVSQASGDSYDFLRTGASTLAVMIGDVTGHGVGAALLTHAAQAAMRSYLELLDDLGQVVSRLNNRLVEAVEPGVFISAVLFVVDAAAKTLSYVNAGHPPLFLVRDGELVEFEKTGMVLGVVEGQDYQVRGPIPLRSGDLIFVRTDGVEETMNAAREVYGVERLKAFLSSHRHLPAAELLSALDASLCEHAGELEAEDDVTMIALRVE
ncbi:MAG: SpoIIE family protein phosphatase [Planctomycetes bacterium]|nr:SpoIIE family protein phosphatase [Planctomycetota bacterium]